MSASNTSTSIQATYNQVASHFSASRQYIWPDLKPYLDQVKSSASVLDLGCGNGRLLLGLPRTVNYTGVDFSTALLEHAKSLHPKTHFIFGDITKQKTWNQLPQFDYIFSIAVIHHLPTFRDQLFVFKQIKKHLKPQGQCLITAWNLWQPRFIKNHLDLKAKIKNLHHLYIPFQGHPRFHFAYTSSYLTKLLRLSGLDLTITRTPKNYLLSNFKSP